jgi:anaerobic ribonucleoside-triphosphate reductase activating protein
LGGDPLEPENRLEIVSLCAYLKHNLPGKSIWLWTGYSWDDVKDLPVMHHIDILVDGPFIEDLKDLRLKWRGSSNQRVIDVQESLRAGEVVEYDV